MDSVSETGLRPGELSAWFPIAPLTGKPELRLFCLHHGGGGASAYRDWQKLLDPRVEVVPVQLPGREGRFNEPCELSIRRLTERLTEPILHRAGDVPFAFFGHSMGALLSYELTYELGARGVPPQHLALSGFAPPHLTRPAGVRLLPDQEFMAHIVGLEGTPADLVELPELLDLLLPVLRADFTACETYEYVEREALRVPVTVFGGSEDPGVEVPMLRRWADLVATAPYLRVFPGGHFYLQEQREELVRALADRLGFGLVDQK
ncbi:thioesterase [Micromonospora orduensis]|uniref:Thioesterase n=1 Tax=Micromonospora orduensis TaxID=1420891 RepID=A0A5C4QD20_9ACTN|nr:alpha/beta fold hydrolase [Micromonospora orduensis]TNH22710.1 thioesterase [Micromonospora orduensis]